MASPATSPATGRTNNLALIFQEMLTVILRVRFPKQSVSDVGEFRNQMRRSISGAAQSARSAGYSDEASQMAIYAVIAFLDESVLVSRDPAFADWARSPLQQEVFGDARAGEKFFGHVQDLLNRPESGEGADILELHALCLLLGFRGRLALGQSGELHSLISRIREKILRIRGPVSLARAVKFSEVRMSAKSDPWIKRLAICLILVAALCLGGYFGYRLLLSSTLRQMSQIETAAGTAR